IRKDGSRFWADVVITALRGSNGELIGYAKVTRDLTERRAADNLLRQSEERFRLLIEGVRDYALFLLDPGGRVTTWNAGAARLKGYTADEIIGEHFSRFYPPEEVRAGKCDRELDQATREGRVEDEGWRVRKDGTRFWANVIITALRSEDGMMLGFAKVTRDLSERKAAEEERLRLAHANEAIRLRDEFMSIAAHELKTPLAALSLQLESVEARARSLDAAIGDRVGRAVRSAQRLDHLVESMLDVGRIATGKFTLQQAKADLVEVARGVLEQLADAAAAAGCAVRLDAPAKVVGCWDVTRIEQVLMALLSNTFKYAAGTPVAVRVERDGDAAILQVRDHGPGIPAEAVERVFGRFERAASSAHYGGLGVGLYVAREIVHAHGGTISAHNADDGGACLTARLPLAYSPAP
ncbi:MAG TPA: PAS domain S-box protein, partial [Kofleriaceae bacterium]|nr:PAS domain S-box protein [Kofleriaceae bacterium]